MSQNTKNRCPTCKTPRGRGCIKCGWTDTLCPVPDPVCPKCGHHIAAGPVERATDEDIEKARAILTLNGSDLPPVHTFRFEVVGPTTVTLPNERSFGEDGQPLDPILFEGKGVIEPHLCWAIERIGPSTQRATWRETRPSSKPSSPASRTRHRTAPAR